MKRHDKGMVGRPTRRVRLGSVNAWGGGLVTLCG